MTKHVARTTKKFLAFGGLAFGVGSLALFPSAGTAAADGLDASPPAIIDKDGTWGPADVSGRRGGDILPAVQTYDTSSYPATPSWPGTS